MTPRAWYLRVRAIVVRRRVERELHEELAFHIAREATKLEEAGWSSRDAQAAAHARFGSLPSTAEQCRDQRGLGRMEDVRRDLVYAVRGFRRAPLSTLTVVATIGLGLGLVASAFTLLSTFLFRVDHVPDIHQMYAVERARTSSDPAPSLTRGEFDALVRETSVFSGLYAEVTDVDSQVDGRTMSGSLVTGDFFSVLGVAPALGRALTPDDDVTGAGRLVMVLSARGWERLFARDPAILGRQVRVNGLEFTVVGVMPDGFRGLMVGPPDYWAPLALLGQMQPGHAGREAEAGVTVVGRLAPGTSREQARASVAAWDASRSSAPTTTRVSDLVLTPRRGTVPQPLEAVAVTAPLFVAFGLILLIGCANVANLLLARGVARHRELGIRLSIGATRRRIVGQLLTESLLLALTSAVVGYVVSRGVLTTIVAAVTTSMPVGIGDVRLAVPDADWRVALFLLAGAVVATGLFGIVPALTTTRMDAVRAMRGEVTRESRPGRARHVLIALQVCASTVLLVCAVVFLRSTFSAAVEDPGVRIADILVVRPASGPTRAALVQAVGDAPLVASMAASWPGALLEGQGIVVRTEGDVTRLRSQFVSPEFFDVLGVDVVQGRSFLPEERTSDLAVAVVSESAARRLWGGRAAVGQVIGLEPEVSPDGAQDRPRLVTRSATVVGVVADVPGFRLAPVDPAVVYVPTSVSSAGTVLVARVHGDPDRAQQRLVEMLSAIDPYMANPGHVMAMTWVTRMVTYLLWLAFWFTVALGAMALTLTLSGLFGVVSYLVEQRTREIGIRMALGAAAGDVLRLVLRETIRPVGAGVALGIAAAAGLAALLLASPVGAGLGGIVRVLDPAAYLAATAVIVTACVVAASVPASRAARLAPTTALRRE